MHCLDINRNRALIQFQADRHPVAAHGNASRLDQGVDRGDGRVAGQRNLGFRCEVAGTHISLRRFKHKCRFREIHLLRNRLHGGSGQVISIKDNRTRIAA